MAILEQYIIDADGNKRVVFEDTDVEIKDFSHEAYLKAVSETTEPIQQFNVTWFKQMKEYYYGKWNNPEWSEVE